MVPNATAVHFSETDTPLPQGLKYFDGFLADSEAAAVLKFIDAQKWDNALSRRVQEYGYTYHSQPPALAVAMCSKGKKAGGAGERTTPIPAEFGAVCKRLVERGLLCRPPEQVIVNEYMPGQGIGAHVDHTKFFGEEIVSISLLSDIVMTFHPVNRGAGLSAACGQSVPAVHLLLKPNSCLSLSGDARYEWTHGIANRKNDTVGLGMSARRIERARRVSLTFRHMLGGDGHK